MPRPPLDSGVAGGYAEILTQRARSLFPRTVWSSADNGLSFLRHPCETRGPRRSRLIFGNVDGIAGFQVHYFVAAAVYVVVVAAHENLSLGSGALSVTHRNDAWYNHAALSRLALRQHPEKTRLHHSQDRIQISHSSVGGRTLSDRRSQAFAGSLRASERFFKAVLPGICRR